MNLITNEIKDHQHSRRKIFFPSTKLLNLSGNLCSCIQCRQDSYRKKVPVMYLTDQYICNNHSSMYLQLIHMRLNREGELLIFFIIVKVLPTAMFITGHDKE